MARAMLTEREKGGRGKKLSQNDESLKPSEQNAISKARFIRDHDEALAQSVMNGAVIAVPHFAR